MSNGNDRSAAVNDCGHDRVWKAQHYEATHVAFTVESVHAHATLREPGGPVHAATYC
jgi:hypothetical protein